MSCFWEAPGKTTLSEAMMFEGKVIDRRGTVEAKNTISDNTEIEQINQRSIYSTPLYTEFMDNKLNIMDTPGADDFIGGVISSFKVCDSGILVVNAQQGVEVGTEIFGRYAENYKKPQLGKHHRLPERGLRQQDCPRTVPRGRRSRIQRFHRRAHHEDVHLQGRQRHP